MVQDSTQNKNRHTPQPESDHHRLEWPATALLMTGILDCVTALLLLCAAGAHMLMDTKLHYFTNAVSWSMLLLSLVIGIVTILGGLKMKQRESRPFVLAAAFLTMVPRFPVTWVFGLASGIWNVIVLSDPKVKAVFPRAKRHRSVEDQVRMPAIGLMLAGALHILFVVSFESELLPTPKLSGPTQFLIVLLAAVLGVQITLGGTKMLRIQSEDWAMKASILALMPIGPGWLLGLPMGIWSLIVLSRPEVKTAFQRVANRNHSD